MRGMIMRLRHIGRWWEYVRLHRGAERDVHILIPRNELTLLVNRACKFDLSSPFLNIPYVLLCLCCVRNYRCVTFYVLWFRAKLSSDKIFWILLFYSADQFSQTGRTWQQEMHSVQFPWTFYHWQLLNQQAGNTVRDSVTDE